MPLRLCLFILIVTCLAGCDLKSPDDYLREAHAVFLTGNYSAAIRLFDKAIQKNPKLKEAYIQRGCCYEYLRQDSMAINSYTKALSIDPGSITANYYMGLYRYRQKRYEAAIEFYNKALAGGAGVYIYKNGLLSDDGALATNPSEIYYNKGLAYYSIWQLKNAFNDFSYCIDNAYHPGESTYMTGLCWLGINKKDKACEAFRRGVSLYADSLSQKELSEICGE